MDSEPRAPDPRGGELRTPEQRISERKLPQNLDAERSVLGSLLLDPSSAAGVMQILTARDFYSPRHQRIFEVIQTLYDQLNTVDTVLVNEETAKRGIAEEVGGLEYLEELVSAVATVANAEYYARIVHEKALLRNVIAACTSVIQRAYESQEPAQEQLDRAEHDIFEISERGASREFIEIHEVIDRQFDLLDRGGAEGLMTGYTDLDSMTTGLHSSEFVIVAGRPSMGKTSFAMNVVQNAASQGKTVGIFSLEVSRDQLVQNLLCSFSRVDAQRLRKNTLSPAHWQDLTDGANRLREFKIFIDDSPNMSPLALKAKARRLDQRHKLDLIVIDYLQLMETPGSENRQQEVSLISRSLKAIARELEVPVIAISQLSRGVENRESHRPRLSDLRESGAIEQDADLVLLLYREEYYYPDKEEARGKAEVIIAKQRNGPTGTAQLTFMSNIMRFENLAATREEVF